MAAVEEAGWEAQDEVEQQTAMDNHWGSAVEDEEGVEHEQEASKNLIWTYAIDGTASLDCMIADMFV
jgi:hypothetical protein